MRNPMKIRVTKSAAPSTLKKPSIVDRLNSPIVRTCVLNLIAQIALGTPMAAQAQRNISTHSIESLWHDCPAVLLRFSGKHACRLGPCRSEGTQKLKNDVRRSRG